MPPFSPDAGVRIAPDAGHTAPTHFLSRARKAEEPTAPRGSCPRPGSAAGVPQRPRSPGLSGSGHRGCRPLTRSRAAGWSSPAELGVLAPPRPRLRPPLPPPRDHSPSARPRTCPRTAPPRAGARAAHSVGAGHLRARPVAGPVEPRTARERPSLARPPRSGIISSRVLAPRDLCGPACPFGGWVGELPKFGSRKKKPVSGV